MLENGLSAPYLLKEYMDFDQTFTDILLRQGQESDFGDLDSIFKGSGGHNMLENGLSAPYLQNEWIDFDQTCKNMLL